MERLAHILVTSDLSPAAIRPCRPVTTLARAMGSKVTLLHVIESSPPTDDVSSASPDLQARMIIARTQLELQSDAFDGLPVDVEVVAGLEVVSSVLEYAEANGVALIVMSTHGRTGIERLVLGSVAEAMVRRSTVPVMVIPRTEEDPAEA